MIGTRPRFVLAVVAAAVTVLAVAAVAGARTRVTTVHVKAAELYFKLSSKTLAKPGVVEFVVTNAGKLTHDFEIDGKRTAMLEPGKTADLTVTLKKKGTYPYKCTVPGHAAAGMKGNFTVR
jgi:uncharacterized cupredoxin-like copper-binding protein